MSAPGPDWPATDAAGVLGDGRFATRTERPATAAQVGAAVRAAAADGLAVYPQGGGTALDFGGIPTRPGVSVRLGRLDRVVDYAVDDMTITVEAGITLAAVRDLVAQHGQRLAIEAGDPECATLGGIFAAACTGPRRFGWGRPRDQIIGVAFVDAAGEVVRGGGRVVKNVAGYDFPKLLTGSLGTLGIITELTLKVNPRPESSAWVRVHLPSLDAASAALDRLNISGTRPIALELTGPSTATNLGPGSRTLVIGLEGNRAAVDWQVARLASELPGHDREVLRDDEAERAWLDEVAEEAAWTTPGRIEEFARRVGVAPEVADRSRLGVFGLRASFAPSVALRFAATLDPGLWDVRVHAGDGVVRAYSAGGLATVSEAETAVNRLRAEADRLGGSVVLTACRAEWKERLGVWGPRRPDWTIAERVKAALDPGCVFNPGRFVGSI